MPVNNFFFLFSLPTPNAWATQIFSVSTTWPSILKKKNSVPWYTCYTESHCKWEISVFFLVRISAYIQRDLFHNLRLFPEKQKQNTKRNFRNLCLKATEIKQKKLEKRIFRNLCAYSQRNRLQSADLLQRELREI
jgi:hypothetical protein